MHVIPFEMLHSFILKASLFLVKVVTLKSGSSLKGVLKSEHKFSVEINSKTLFDFFISALLFSRMARDKNEIQ